MNPIVLLGGLALFIAIFIPQACSSTERQRVVSPDRHEFLGITDFAKKYGTPEERAWAEARTRPEEKEEETSSSEDPPEFHGF